MKNHSPRVLRLAALVAAAILALSSAASCKNPSSSSDSSSDDEDPAPATYAVSYDANGAGAGSVPTDSKKYASGDTVRVSGNTGALVKAGFDFGGWNTRADGKGTALAPGSSFAMGSSDVKLYAAWLDTSKAITSFGFTKAKNAALSANITGRIEGSGISVTVPNGTAVSSLVATFATTGASVSVGSIAQTSGSTSNDFSMPKTYTVTGADGSTRDYAVTVAVSAVDAKEIAAFRFAKALNPSLSADAEGTISGSTIAVKIPNPTSSVSLTSLVATFSYKGSSVKVGAALQSSGSTANDFTGAVTYLVAAADGSTASYTVNASLETDATPAADVAGLAAVSGNAQVALSWTPPTDSDFASVEISSSPSAAGSPWAVAKGTSARTITGLTNGTMYAFTIKSVDVAGNRSAGATKSEMPAAFRVTYKGNGSTSGSVPYDGTVYGNRSTVAVIANIGSLICIPAARTAEAKKFGGWNTKADGTGTTYPAGSGTFTITEDTTLYAYWIAFSVRDTGPAGGLIFYDKGSFSEGWRYLEAAPASTETRTTADYLWGGWGIVVNGADGTAIGTGRQNTADIVAQFGATEPYEGKAYVAKACDDLSVTNGGATYSDWFLPSVYEVREMHVNLNRHGVGGFSSGGSIYYLSSSESDSRAIVLWAWSFNSSYDGMRVEQTKATQGDYVRACREF
jgi:hypothetical protein